MRLTMRPLAVVAVLVAAVLAGPQAASAAPALTVATITWNVIGLDSNDPAVGPNVFPVGVRVCNGGTSDATGLEATFVWDSENPYLSLEGPAVVTAGDLAAGACTDVYWNVVIERTAAAYDTARGYHVTVTDASGATAATPTPRELYVQSILSQNRNQVLSITGPATLTVGDEATFILDASTAPNGYEQIEAFLTLPSSLFQLLSVSTTYDGPPRTTTDLLYSDACGWDDDPTSPTYLNCIGPENVPGGKAGGALLIEYRVRALAPGETILTAAIYDKSGASYHYNSDFGIAPNLFLVTIAPPPVVPAPLPGDPGLPGVLPPDIVTTATPGVTPVGAPAGPVAVPELPRTGLRRQLAVAGGLLVFAGILVLIAVRRAPPRTVIRID